VTPERIAKLVTRWVRFYTRDLPPAIAERRAGEIEADVHDHIAHERARGTGDRRIAVSILSRMARGLAADASWRWRVRPRKGHAMPLLAGLAIAILATGLGVAAIVLGEADDAPGLQLIGGLLVIGALLLGVRTAQRDR
jgi:hypothetical protein